jgi:hypothetical protein
MNEGSPELPLKGRCMCGAVRFEIDKPLVGALYCHCHRCQRRSGSAFSISALTEPGSFRVTAGEEHLRVWDPGDGGYRKSFCSLCGSHPFTSNPEQPEIVAVRMGTLEGDPGIRPGAHQFVSYAAPWGPELDDGAPRWPERIGVGDPL